MRATQPGVKTKDLFFVAPAEASFQGARSGARDRNARRTSTHQRQANLHMPLSQILLGFLVITAPHLLGGIFAWASLAMGLVACGAVCFALYSTRGSRERPRHSEPLGAALGAMVAVTLLHALPLPSALAAWLAPAAANNARETAVGLGLGVPSLIPFSLDPGGTHERILYGVALFAAFCAARIEHHGRRGESLLVAVAVSTVLIAVSDLLHRALGANAVYGIYTPQMALPRGPLLNPNNLAGFLTLGFPVCLGLAVRGVAYSWGWLLAGAVVAATNLLAGSRGGTAALVGAGLLFGILCFRQSTAPQQPSNVVSRANRKQRLGGIALVLLAGGMALALARLGTDDFIDNNYQDLNKLDLYREELALLIQNAHMALLGSGRGSFGVAFAVVNPWFTRAREAECLPLQYAIEFGIPFACVFVGVFAYYLARGLWISRSPSRLGGLVGVLALGIQNLVDFSLELSGIAVPAIVCLAVSLPTISPRRRSRFRAFGLWNMSAAGLVACALLLAIFGTQAIQNDHYVAARRLKEYFASRDSASFWELFSEISTAHPSDAGFALLAAGQSVKENRPNATFWIRRATLLAPGSGLPHLWSAQYLAKNGHWDAALSELRVAAERDTQKMLNGLCPWLQKVPTAQTVLKMAPEAGEARIAVLDAGARCLVAFPNEAAELDALLLSARPEHLQAKLRDAQRQLDLRHWAVAIDRARKVQTRSRALAAAYLIEADGLIGLNRPREAEQRLSEALHHSEERTLLLAKLAQANAAGGNATKMRQTIDQLRMAAAGDLRKLADAYATLGRCELQLHNDHQALKAFRTAYRLSPNPSFLENAAHLAAKLGQTDFAISAWGHLCNVEANPARFCTTRDALRAQHGPQP